MIPFNQPAFLGNETLYIKDVIDNRMFCGNQKYTQKCNTWFKKTLKCSNAILVSSCTHALEIAALLLNIKKGDEIIMPSFTFVSTANAFALRGAKCVFIDIRPDTMNINENLIEKAITKRTKAIVVMHYGGISCNMDKIMNIAQKHNIYVIEDAAQAMMAKYKNNFLGTIGDIGTYSFHETKNYTCGEGGLLIINNDKFSNRAEIIRDKGTNRMSFHRGEVDKYTWVDLGSSYIVSELNAAYLYGQLQKADQINQNRINIWNNYYEELLPLKEKGLIELPFIPSKCSHNAHLFYIKVRDNQQQTDLIKYLNNHNIMAVFHYIPLHSSYAGKKYGHFYGKDYYTTKESKRLVRLPFYYGLSFDDRKYITNTIKTFFKD
jgi:dTDP-4-amino-4,6-dideoxygalactose transaminase